MCILYKTPSSKQATGLKNGKMQLVWSELKKRFYKLYGNIYKY